MNLGIEEKHAIVCAASNSLGRGCASALGREGVRVAISARTRDTLEATARAIEAETGTPVAAVVADVATPEGRAALLAACPDPDILVAPGADVPRQEWFDAGERVGTPRQGTLGVAGRVR
jgi:3-oxoacyl-[acyl-carrier protein] reductase